jgi:hypothetical protein
LTPGRGGIPLCTLPGLCHPILGKAGGHPLRPPAERENPSLHSSCLWWTLTRVGRTSYRAGAGNLTGPMGRKRISLSLVRVRIYP